MKNLLGEILITPIGNILTTKITFALVDWIRKCRKSRDKNLSIDDCVKFFQWKLEDYKLSDSDKRIYFAL